MKFIRQDGHKKKRLGTKWRKPKGYQSKMRLQKKGYHAVVKVGYGRKSEDKGKDKTGKVIIVVSTVMELKKINPETQSVFVSATIGKRKKLELFDQAQKLKINLTNVSQEMIDKIKKEKDSKVQLKKEIKEKKLKKDKKKEEKKEEKGEKKEIKEIKDIKKEESKSVNKPTEDKKQESKENSNENKKQKREQEKILIKKQ